MKKDQQGYVLPIVMVMALAISSVLAFDLHGLQAQATLQKVVTTKVETELAMMVEADIFMRTLNEGVLQSCQSQTLDTCATRLSINQEAQDIQIEVQICAELPSAVCENLIYGVGVLVITASQPLPLTRYAYLSNLPESASIFRSQLVPQL